MEEPLPVEESLPVEEPHFQAETQGLEEPEQLEPAARPSAVQTGPGPLSAGVLQVGGGKENEAYIIELIPMGLFIKSKLEQILGSL